MKIKQNSFQAWMLAARPKTLTGAIIPVLVGVALACYQGEFHIVPALLCLFFACGMQISANFINDLFDYLKGSDRNDRLGPQRACAEGWITPRAMKLGIGIAITISCLMGLGLFYMAWQQSPYQGFELIATGALCVLFAFLYTTCLSYLGLGDLLVLLFFGFVPVCGSFYVQTLTLTSDVMIASIICGLLIDTLLVINNYRDREQDAISKKRTLIVRFGATFGHYFYLALGIVSALLCLWFAKGGNLSAILLPIPYVVLHIRTWKKMVSIGSGVKLNSILGETSRNMLLLGISLCAIILIGKYLCSEIFITSI